MRRSGGRRAPSRPGALPPPPRAGPRCPRAQVSPRRDRGAPPAYLAAGRAEGGRGRPPPGSGEVRADVWAPAAPVSHTFQSPVDGVGGQQVCYSPSDGGPDGDCCSLRIAGADSRTRASGPHTGTAQRPLASSSALRVSLASRRPRCCWPQGRVCRRIGCFCPVTHANGLLQRPQVRAGRKGDGPSRAGVRGWAGDRSVNLGQSQNSKLFSRG